MSLKFLRNVIFYQIIGYFGFLYIWIFLYLDARKFTKLRCTFYFCEIIKRHKAILFFRVVSVVKVLIGNDLVITISSTVMEPQKPRIVIYTPFNVSLNSRSLIWSFDCRRKISCLKNFSEQSNREKSEKKILAKFFKNDKLMGDKLTGFTVIRVNF